QAKYFSAKPSWNAASGISRKLPLRVAPALLTSTSQRPSFSCTKACSASQASSVFRSPASVSGFGPLLPIVAAAASRFACDDAASTVCAPSRANDCAIARPIPRLPPVTTTTLSENSPIPVLAFLCPRSCRVHSPCDQRGSRMSDFYVAVGDTTSFSKTVGEYDVYAFAGISGDFAPNHVNKAYMAKSGYGRLIAHGALLVGYMSTASTQMAAHSRADASVT